MTNAAYQYRDYATMREYMKLRAYTCKIGLALSFSVLLNIIQFFI